MRSPFLGGLIGLMATACAVHGQPGAAPPAPVAGTGAGAGPGTGTGLAEVVRAARDDAARRTGVAAAALELVGAEAVTWSDGSLGCPQPGVMYTQALVPGWRVRLRGPSGELDYHAGARGALVLCPAGRILAPLPGAAVR